MGFQKNVASQKWRVFAFDRTDNTPKTGDAGQITSKIAVDYGTRTASNDTYPTELEDGYYEFDMTQGESNGDVLDIYPESSTDDIQVIGVPGRSFTVPSAFAATAMRGTDSAATAVSLATVDGIVDNILVDTGTTIPGTITVVDAVVDAILVDTAVIGAAGAGLTDLGGMSTGMKAEVNVEAKDVINTDTITLPGQTAPPLAPTVLQAIGWMYKVLRNRKTETATQWSLLADNESTVDAKATTSDDGTTATKQEIITGP